jgi:hypothetical protein
MLFTDSGLLINSNFLLCQCHEFMISSPLDQKLIVHQRLTHNIIHSPEDQKHNAIANLQGVPIQYMHQRIMIMVGPH